jgi:hypothetical protein
VLLLDNAPSHPRDKILTSADGLIAVKSPPPQNITAIIQSMDQEVIVSTKQCNQADLLRTLANENDVIASRKKMMVLDAIYGISHSWSSMNPVTLV